MASFVKIRNNKTGVESQLTKELFDLHKERRDFKNAYKVVTIISEPPEVVELNKRLKESEKENK